MRILVVGAGAREHAIASKLAAESGVDEVLATPGNPGIASVARLVGNGALDPPSLLALAEAEGVDLTVVGPEQPLAEGVVDTFDAAGRLAFGPTRAAARLETSKAFAKAFMARHRIPTARYEVCRDLQSARAALDRFGLPVVVKADGLAAGKGVVVADDAATAASAIHAALVDDTFGEAGHTLVVEEFMHGAEASFFAVCDGRRAVPLGTAQDHKRAFDDDRGPNTGGMGAFSPSPLIDAGLSERVMREIVDPLVAGMAAEGSPYRGVLYVGLMLTTDGPRVVEFNVRFGDPETQVVLPALAGPIAPLLVASARGALEASAVPSSVGAHVGVVLASGGYPGAFARGQVITGLGRAEALDGVQVFHAGTKLDGSHLVTSGGRVLTVVGSGASGAEAIERAYAAAEIIHFDGCHFRRDIGRRALAASNVASER